MKRSQTAGYVALLLGCLLVSTVIGWTLGPFLDNDVYDLMFRWSGAPEGEPSAVIAGIDEESFHDGGVSGTRRILAEGLMKMAEAPPLVVALDYIVADKGREEDDAVLEQAFAKTKNLILSTDLKRNEQWEILLPRFEKPAAAVAHVHSDPDRHDNVLRQIPLEKASRTVPPKRYFALALEAYRLATGAQIVESPEALEAGSLRIVTPQNEARPMRIRYRDLDAIPVVTFHQLRTDPNAAAKLKGKIVFVGLTAQSAAQDRHMTPFSYGRTMPGVEIHANAYETLRSGQFLVDASNSAVVVFCIFLCAAVGVIFARWSGWAAYGPAAVLLAMANLAPWLAFRQSIVFPYTAPLATAWLSTAAAASFQYFVVRRQLRRSQAERDQYQRAIHFVAHEMRSPLTAIQGSSELMGRYKLTEEKRSEMAKMINAESKRLAKMIQTFLDVERLNAGQMELKREPFAPAEVVLASIERVRPLAERKQIAIDVGPIPEAALLGDRELLEYAVYNLMTNAVKYSPGGTQVTISAAADRGEWRVSVRDQGIGMDERELNSIFQKFYRTKKAEQSGEAGTGIGLSIVEQIVTHHGGKMEVTSSPGAGSCFTIVLPASRPLAPDPVRGRVGDSI